MNAHVVDTNNADVHVAKTETHPACSQPLSSHDPPDCPPLPTICPSPHAPPPGAAPGRAPEISSPSSSSSSSSIPPSVRASGAQGMSKVGRAATKPPPPPPPPVSSQRPPVDGSSRAGAPTARGGGEGIVLAPQATKNPPVPRASLRPADGPTKAHTVTGKGAGSVATTSSRLSAVGNSAASSLSPAAMSPAAAAAVAVAATRRPAVVSSTGKPGAVRESPPPQTAGNLTGYRPAARGSGASPERSLSSAKGGAMAPLRSAPRGARPPTGQATKATRESAVASEATTATPASLVASSPASSTSSATPTSYSHEEAGRAGRGVPVSRDSSAPTSTAASAVAAVAGAASATDRRSKPTDVRRSIVGKGGPSAARDGVVAGPKRSAPREATPPGKARGMPSKAAVEETAGKKSQLVGGVRTNEMGSMRNDRAFSEEGSAWPMSTDGAGQSRIERALTPDQPASLPRRPVPAKSSNTPAVAGASATPSHQGGSGGARGKERRNVSRVEPPRAETIKPSHLSEAAASSMGNGGAAGKAGEGPAVAQRGPRARTVSPPPIGGSTLPGARSSGGNEGALRGADRTMPHPIGVQAMDVDVRVPLVEGPGSGGQVRDSASESSGAKGGVSAGGAARTGAATAPVESGRSEAGQRLPDERATAEGAFGAEVAVGDEASSDGKQLAGKHGMKNAGHIEGAGRGVARGAPGAAAGASAGRQGQPPAGLRGSMWFAGEAPTPAQSSSGQPSSKVPTMRETSPSDVSGSCDDDAAAAAASHSSGVEPVGALAPRAGPTDGLSIGEASSLERPGVAPAHAQTRELEAGVGVCSRLLPGEEAEIGAETGRSARLGANGDAVVSHTETATASAKPGAVRPDTLTSSSEQAVDGIQQRGRAEGGAGAREVGPAVTATSAPSFPPGSEALGSFSRMRGTAGLGRELSPGPHAALHSDDDTPASNSPTRGDAVQALAASLTKGRLGASSVPRTSDSMAGPSIGPFRPEPGVTGFGSSAPRAGVGGGSFGRGAVAATAGVVAPPPSSSPVGQISLAQQSQKAHDAIALRRREDELASRVAANFSFFSETGGVAEGGASATGAGRASETIPRGAESVREGPPSVPGQTWRPSAIISPGGGSGGGGVGGDGALGEREAVYKRGRQSPGVMSGGVVGAVGPNPLVSRPPALRPEVGVHRRVGSGFEVYPPAYGSPPSPAASASASGVAAAAAASAATPLPAVSFSRFRGGGYGSRFNTSHSVSARIRVGKTKAWRKG